jgi:hypothetical protein
LSVQTTRRTNPILLFQLRIRNALTEPFNYSSDSIVRKAMSLVLCILA